MKGVIVVKNREDEPVDGRKFTLVLKWHLNKHTIELTVFTYVFIISSKSYICHVVPHVVTHQAINKHQKQNMSS